MSILKVDELQSRTSGNRITLPDVNNYPPYRNIIINGDMSIAQRGTSETGITSFGYFTVDRWQFGTNSFGGFTMSQDTDVPTGQGFAKSTKIDCTTAKTPLSAGDNSQFFTKFEGQMLQYLKKGTSSAESLTLSFWVKSNKTGTYIAELFDDDNTRQISKSYTIDASNTWEKKTLTYDGDTTGAFNNDNNGSLSLRLWLAAGSNFTSGTLATSWASNTNANRAVGQVNLADNTANEWYITGVQLEVGTSATPFEFIPYDVNILRCERYFERLNREASTTERVVTGGWFNTTTNLQGAISYSEKRTQPTITINNLGNFRVNYLNSATTPSSASANTIGKKLSTISWAVTGMTAGQGGSVRTDTTSATIDVDAEL